MEEVDYIDTESYQSSSNDAIGFQQIVLKHLYTLSKFASVEMMGGYWQKKAVPVNNSLITTEVYVPDAREVYANAVQHLYDLLLAYFDETMKADAESHKTKSKAIYEATTQAVEGIDEELGVREFTEQRFETIYKKKKYELSRELFQNLSLFLKRNGYLKTKDLEVGD